MQEVVSETASCALKTIDHGLKPELIPCSIKCARLLHVQPVSLRGALSSSVLRERVETAEGFIYKYISNHRTELLRFWQGFLWPLQTIHCCSKAVSANWLRASLPGGAKKKKTQQMGEWCWWQDVPRTSGFSPLCLLCCGGSTNNLHWPPAWPVHWGFKGKILFKIIPLLLLWKTDDKALDIDRDIQQKVHVFVFSL